MTTRTIRRRRRYRPMPDHVQVEIMGCILIGAVIAGMIIGPSAYILTHLL